MSRDCCTLGCMNRLKIVCYIFLFYFLTFVPRLTAADIAFVTVSAKGDYYFKMSASGRTMPAMEGPKMEGIAFRAKSGDRDEVLWRTSGWFADNLFLSSDGTTLVRVEEDMMYLYKNGLELASRPAKSTSLGDRILIDARRSGFIADERDFRLVTAAGKTEIFSLSVEQLSFQQQGKSELAGLKTIAQGVESTVSYERSVRNYAEVQVNVEGQNRRSRSTVTNSIPGKQSASTCVGVQNRVDTNSSEPLRAESSSSKVTIQQPVHGTSDPFISHGMFECRVEAQLYASATREKVTSTRQVHQSGSTRAMALDRAMAYCEGVVGAGSNLPRGRCVPRECTDQNPDALVE
ncbi:MAG: hypothetical protein ACI8W1_002283 [Candidatus Azotimanducaceae bacterium]